MTGYTIAGDGRHGCVCGGRCFEKITSDCAGDTHRKRKIALHTRK